MTLGLRLARHDTNNNVLVTFFIKCLHPSKENSSMDPIIVALFSSFMIFIADMGKYLF